MPHVPTMTTVVPAHSESSTEKLSSVAHLTVDEVAKLSLQTDNTPARVVYKDLYRNATRSDLYVLAVSTLCAIIAGATLPLMAVLYGSLAGTVSVISLSCLWQTCISSLCLRYADYCNSSKVSFRVPSLEQRLRMRWTA